MSKVAFLGAGNMASAIVEGLIDKGTFRHEEIVCYSASGRTANSLAARTGIKAVSSLADLLATADILVVAFKPQHLAPADPALAELTANKLVISVLSGKRTSSLRRAFPQARNIVRTMPNTPGRIGAGITAWCPEHPLTATDRTHVTAMLSALGQAVEMDEVHLDAATAVSGSGAGFVFEFAAALCAAGEAADLPPEVARQLALETLLGSARLIARTGENPEKLRDQVTSPNGTTFAGLERLRAGDFRGLIRETVLAAKARAVELSQDS